MCVCTAYSNYRLYMVDNQREYTHSLQCVPMTIVCRRDNISSWHPVVKFFFCMTALTEATHENVTNWLLFIKTEMK